MSDHAELNRGQAARATAALDQLLAALNEILDGNGLITKPIIVIAKTQPGAGLTVFHAGLETMADVPPVLRAAAKIIDGRPADFRRGS